MSIKIYENAGLKLEVHELEDAVEIIWIGKSTAREPGAFITPILTALLQESQTNNRTISMDFRRLEYMNSSTITPVIRILNEAKRGSAKVLIVYDGKSRWQGLSFSALAIFQTEDKRIEIRGA